MNPLENRFLNRVLHKALWAALLPLCALWGVTQAVATRPDAAPGDDQASAQTPRRASGRAAELPTDWNGAALRPLALSEVEQRFAARFPGSVARMTDGTQVLVLRTVNQPTRMLHPATDCYRGLGYRIQGEQLEQQADQHRWRCFVAERAGQRLRVCERIEDAQGQGFTDASAWYWASVAGRSSGPWKALTVATRL